MTGLDLQSCLYSVTISSEINNYQLWNCVERMLSTLLTNMFNSEGNEKKNIYEMSAQIITELHFSYRAALSSPIIHFLYIQLLVFLTR